MSKESYVSDKNGVIVGKDITDYNKDGSSKTTHETAWSNLFGVQGGSITGVTQNNPDGTSTYTKK